MTAVTYGQPYAAVTPQKASDLVAHQLRSQIIRGELPLDAALPPESTLMEQFGVSRPTLREAFRILESEGLITVRRGAQGGARAQVPSARVAARYAGMVLQYQGATLRDLAEARQIIEPPAAGILAKRGRASDVAALEESLAQEVARDRSQDAMQELWHEPFHVKVVELTGNQTLTLFARMTGHMLHLAKTAYLARVDVPGSTEVATSLALAERSHRKLIQHIRGGDAKKAEEFWSRHLAAAADRILATMPEARAIDLLQ